MLSVLILFVFLPFAMRFMTIKGKGQIKGKSIITEQPLTKAAMTALQWNFYLRFFAVVGLLCAGMFTLGDYSSRTLHSGMTAYQQGNYRTAEADFARVEWVDPTDVEAPYYRGLCLRQEGRPGAALSAFKMVHIRLWFTKHRSSSNLQVEQDAQGQIDQLNSTRR